MIYMVDITQILIQQNYAMGIHHLLLQIVSLSMIWLKKLQHYLSKVKLWIKILIQIIM